MIKYQRRWVEPERYLQRWLDPRLGSIRVVDVTAYLRRRGWKQVTPDRRDTLVFQEPVLFFFFSLWRRLRAAGE